MCFTSRFRTCLIVAGALSCAAFLPAQQQSDQEPAAKEVEFKGMPPRVAPTEYQAHASAGKVTIGAEFMGHFIPTPDHTFSTEDYIIVEAGIFGPAGARTTLSRDDFSLRVNGKKNVLPSEPYELVFRSLKDPEWQPPKTDDDKESKGGITGGAGGLGNEDKLPPLPPKMPFELRRAMELQVQRSFMEQGDRALPQAGLLFFQYHGKREGIRSVELIYSGAGGNVTIPLQP